MFVGEPTEINGLVMPGSWIAAAWGQSRSMRSGSFFRAAIHDSAMARPRDGPRMAEALAEHFDSRRLRGSFSYSLYLPDFPRVIVKTRPSQIRRSGPDAARVCTKRGPHADRARPPPPPPPPELGLTRSRSATSVCAWEVFQVFTSAH